MKINQLPPYSLFTVSRFAYSQPYHVLGHKQSHVHFTVCTHTHTHSRAACYDNCHVDAVETEAHRTERRWRRRLLSLFEIPPALSAPLRPSLRPLPPPVLRCKINEMGKNNKATATKKMIYEPTPLHKNLFTTNCQNGTFLKAHPVGRGAGAGEGTAVQL